MDYRDAVKRQCGGGHAYVRTYGCQQNMSDGEKLKGLLVSMGYTLTDTPEGADLILFNTCAVRENAENRVFGNVGALKALKRQKPGLIIGVCGCMVTQESAALKLRARFPFVDLIFGTAELSSFPRLLFRFMTEGGRILSIGGEQTVAEGLPLVRDGSLKAWVPVMQGCNNFCSYCVVPYVRGREQSRSPEAVLEEVRGLVGEGYKEITLLGQNVNSYGAGTDYNFPQLVREIDDIPGEFWVRFMTSHPKDASDELFSVISAGKKLCRHIHLPVQSGSNRILSLMNRRYSREDYIGLIERARRIVPGVTFSSDIIVGFPSETYEEFCDTLSLIRVVGYQSLFTFIFSKRDGTKAASMEDNVPEDEKSRWFRELLEVQNEIGAEINRSYVGSIQRVLVEEDTDKLTGRTESGLPVTLTGSAKVGSFVKARITNARMSALDGEILINS